jgi:hypothetical protein
MAKSQIPAGEQLASELAEFGKESRTFYDKIVRPRWDSHSRRYPHTLYAYVMRAFSFVDLLSKICYEAQNDQTRRMTLFVCDQFHVSREVAFIAIQMWRHELMHSAFPKQLEFDGHTYVWLLHWAVELPRKRHLTFDRSGARSTLNLSLLYLTENLKQSWSALVENEDIACRLQSDSSNFQPYANSKVVKRPKWW